MKKIILILLMSQLCNAAQQDIEQSLNRINLFPHNVNKIISEYSKKNIDELNEYLIDVIRYPMIIMSQALRNNKEIDNAEHYYQSELDKIIKEGANNLNYALFIAIGKKNTAALRALLENGVNANTLNANGETPLLAILNGYIVNAKRFGETGFGPVVSILLYAGSCTKGFAEGLEKALKSDNDNERENARDIKQAYEEYIKYIEGAKNQIDQELADMPQVLKKMIQDYYA